MMPFKNGMNLGQKEGKIAQKTYDFALKTCKFWQAKDYFFSASCALEGVFGKACDDTISHHTPLTTSQL